MAQTPVLSMALSPAAALAQAETGKLDALVVGGKRKPIRRDPEKRRQQNLQAQKKYREKLRQRLDTLEMLAASVAKSRGIIAEATTAAVPPVPASLVSNETSSPDLTPEDWSLPDTPKAVDMQERQIPSITPHDSSISPPARDDPPATDLALWDSRTSIDPSYLIMTNYDHPGAEKELWYTAYVDCGCPKRHVEVRSKTPGACHGVEIVRVGESVFSPRANHLRIEIYCTISAMWANSQQLGYSPSAFCSDDSQSSFYRPGACLAGPEQSSVVQTVQRIYKTLKPDLRPTKEQVLFPHDQFVDMLPFPTLRKNLVTCPANTTINEEELCVDLLNGLTCWGGVGLGKSDHGGGRAASSATPWDSRSWEAKPWFLRKYWRLLGGDDGELVRQSEWWRNMRGEGDEDVWASACEQPPAESLAFSLAKLSESASFSPAGEW